MSYYERIVNNNLEGKGDNDDKIYTRTTGRV